MSYCDIWFAPNALADEWAKKIRLVKEDGGAFYAVKGFPCWKYEWRSDADEADGVTKILTTYRYVPALNDECWYGVCRHHARVFTVMFQERVKGKYNIIDGKSVKAMYIRAPSLAHVWLEVYIKGEGYYTYDVLYPLLLMRGQRGGEEMGNRWNCGDKTYGLTSYDPKWAGPAPTAPPAKTYIKATTTPSNASIWLKKY